MQTIYENFDAYDATIAELLAAINRSLGPGKTKLLDEYGGTVGAMPSMPTDVKIRLMGPGGEDRPHDLMWIEASAVRGGSEGWWVHVFAHYQVNGVKGWKAGLHAGRLVGISKTFAGMEAAAEAAKRINKMLDQWF